MRDYYAATRGPGTARACRGTGKEEDDREEFLAAIDKIAKFAVPLATLAEIAQPLTVRLGLGTGKSRSESFNLPPGRVIVGALCSMARRGQTLRGMEQGPDGCMLEAALPSDMWSLEGDLFVTIRRVGAATRVEAATKVRGQLFDWGKSKAVLGKSIQRHPQAARVKVDSSRPFRLPTIRAGYWFLRLAFTGNSEIHLHFISCR